MRFDSNKTGGKATFLRSEPETIKRGEPVGGPYRTFRTGKLKAPEQHPDNKIKP